MSDVGALADEYWDYYRGTAQLWNIDRGDVDQIEHWEDFSPAGVAERVERLSAFAQRAGSLGTSAQGERERTMLGALAFSARSEVAALPYVRDLSLVAGPFSFVTFLSTLVPAYALMTRHHGAGYVEKLRALPAFVDGWVAGLRDGRARGRTATARGVAEAIASYDALLRTDPAQDPLTAQAPPAELSAAEAERWRLEVIDAVRDVVRPALGWLRDILRDEVLPAARSDEAPGLCFVAGGDEAYAGLLRAATSTDLTAASVHEIGLQQLARLDDEYTLLGGPVLGLDDPARIRDRLRTDAALCHSSADEVVADVAAAMSRAHAEAPRWFDRLPAAVCTPVRLESGPLAFYTAPSPDGHRGGTFFYNAADPAAWRRYLVEVSVFHEAIPGHHLQLALALELDLHPVLGQLEVASYSEGWGLYAERLADEMSLYSSPLQRLGMLAMDSLRAARLVADTGLHAMAWTRDETIDFLCRRGAQSHANATLEVDRYIADPGQAAAYMIGRLELERLRRHATTSLGDRFSHRAFHGVVLGHGNVPLAELARCVDTWIAGGGQRQR
jgi:uncharacterized protein (DUF885 family)